MSPVFLHQKFFSFRGQVMYFLEGFGDSDPGGWYMISELLDRPLSPTESDYIQARLVKAGA